MFSVRVPIDVLSVLVHVPLRVCVPAFAYVLVHGTTMSLWQNNNILEIVILQEIITLKSEQNTENLNTNERFFVPEANFYKTQQVCMYTTETVFRK
jgi:hypothetical protein